MTTLVARDVGEVSNLPGSVSLTRREASAGSASGDTNSVLPFVDDATTRWVEEAARLLGRIWPPDRAEVGTSQDAFEPIEGGLRMPRHVTVVNTPRGVLLDLVVALPPVTRRRAKARVVRRGRDTPRFGELDLYVDPE